MTPSSTSASKFDHPLPELAPVEQDRDRPDLAGLDQGQQLERLVERAEAARKHRHGARAEQEVHLAQREIVELEAQRRGDVGVGRLFVGQHDVEPDDSAPTSCAPRLAASMIDGPPPEQTTNWRRPSSSGGRPGWRSAQVRARRRNNAPWRPAARRSLFLVGPGVVEQRLGLGRLGHSRRAVERRRSNRSSLVEEQFGLQQFELEAHRAQVLAKQEFVVLEGQLVGRMLGLRAGRNVLGGFGVDLGVGKDALGGYWISHKRPRLAEVARFPKGCAGAPFVSRATCPKWPQTESRPKRRRAGAPS